MTPTRALTPCAQHGCPTLVPRGRCPDHQRKHYRHDAQMRGSASERGYDAKWRRVRNAHLRKHPLCEHCRAKGRVTAASLVDHIIPLVEGGARLDPSNLQSLCRSCHSVKTAEDNR